MPRIRNTRKTRFHQIHAIAFAIGVFVSFPTISGAQDPLVYDIFPSQGSTVGNQNITVTWRACSNQPQSGPSWSYLTQVNGTNVPTTPSSAFGICSSYTYKNSYSAPATLIVGNNVISAKVCTSSGCGTTSIQVTYTPGTPGISITPHGGTASPILVGNSGSFVFTVTNTGNVTATPVVNFTCPALLQYCSVTSAGGALNPGNSVPVTASYQGASAGTTQITVSGNLLEYPSTTDNGTASVTVNNPPSYSVSVGVDDADPMNLPAGTTSITQRYTISNTSQFTTTASTFSLNMSTTGIVSSCPALSPMTLSPGGSQSIFVTCNIGPASGPSTGTVRLTASTSSPVVMSNYVQRTVNTTPLYSVTVTPTVSVATEPAQATSGSQTFTVRNNSQNTGASTINLTRVCSGVLTCSTSMSPVTVVEGSSLLVTVPYGVQLSGTTGTLQLIASVGTGGGNASMTVNATPVYQFILTRDSASQILSRRVSSGSSGFTVKNNGTNTGSLTLTLSDKCIVVAGCPTSQRQVSLTEGSVSTQVISYSVDSVGVTGSVTFKATSSTPFAYLDSVTTTLTPTADLKVVLTANPADTLLPARSTSGAATFTIRNASWNTSGSTSFSYNFRCTGVAAACAPSPGVLSLAQFAQAPVNYTYPVDSAGTIGAVKIVAATRLPYVVTDSVTANVRTTPSYSIVLTPGNGADTVGLGTTFTRDMRISNTSWNSANPITVAILQPTCSGVTISCSLPTNSNPIAQGAQTPIISLTYNALANGTESVALQTSASVTGGTVGAPNATFTVTVGSTGTITTVTSGLNPRTTIERGDCLTIAAAQNAAYQCGDLRIAYALPATTTMGKARVPTLLYNSRQARPTAWLAADVTYTGPHPQVLLATVTVPNRPTITKQFNWDRACNGQKCRIVVPIDATATMTTGLYVATLQVNAGASTFTYATSATVTDTVVIVDRTKSPFGAGWWLGGLEQIIHLSSTQKLWVGGDGSTRLFARVSTDSPIFVVSSPYDRPDTLYRVSATVWRRFLPDSAYVEFDSTAGGLGTHVRTRNDLGWVTTFAYNTADLGTPLRSITLPVPAGSTMPRVYNFFYTKNGALESALDSVVAPRDTGSRVVKVTRTNFWINRIVDPDGLATAFVYGTPSYLTQRINKLSDTTYFYYDSAGALNRAGVGMSRTATNALDSLPITITFRAAETRGAAGPTDTATPLARGYSQIDGPRTDVGDTTNFYVNRWGAPDTVVNALGNRTRVVRGVTQFPALVTNWFSPSGFERRAYYDTTRALIDSTEDIDPYDALCGNRTCNAITKYKWDPKWNKVASVRAPTGELDSTFYNASRPVPDSTQVGTNAANRTQFMYNPASWQVDSIRPPVNSATQWQRFGYDPLLGNITSATTPIGFISRSYADAVGRDTLVVTPTDSASGRTQTGLDTTGIRVVTRYDAMGRVLHTETLGAKLSGVDPQRVVVDNVRDAEGAVTTLQRQSVPDSAHIGLMTTQWRYDALGRKIAEIAPDLAVENLEYDRASNVRVVRTRRTDPTTGLRLAITMEYDALNRLRTREIPPVVYPRRNEGIPYNFSTLNQVHGVVPQGENPKYPRYSNNPDSGLTIPADTARLDYDNAGNLIKADNRDAWVRRSYFRNGMLKLDSLYTRTVLDTSAGGNFSQHSYGLEYVYDLSGRRTVLKHPAQLVAGATLNQASFGYDPVTGGLATVTDIQSNIFSYHYTPRGDVDSLYMPLGFLDGYGYDADGNQTRHTDHAGANWFRDASVRYDARGKVIWQGNGYNYQDTTRTTYSGLGHVVADSMVSYGVANTFRYQQKTNEQFLNDALGNLRKSNTTRESVGGSQYFNSGAIMRTQLYRASTGRFSSDTIVVQSIAGNQTDTAAYDGAGNTVFTKALGWSPGSTIENRASFYAADGKLYAADYRSLTDNTAVNGTQYFSVAFEEYRYDALGRRVWLRSRRFCETPSNFECNLSFIRRTVWDGDAELYEIQKPGWNGTPVNTLENDTAPDSLPLSINGDDRNSYFGGVAYTHGLGVDRPLSVVRFRYANMRDTIGNPLNWAEFPAFAVVPLWNARGKADRGYFVAPGSRYCLMSQPQRCVFIEFLAAYDVLSYGNWNRRPVTFHGTLIDDKRDKTGTWYRRNRNYDPGTGRFTQEDPIGLTGGLNLYGFAGGDPMNHQDPFGLCPDPRDPVCRFTVAGGRAPGVVLGTTLAGIGQAAQKWWDEHGETVINIGFALISEGRSLGSEEPLTAGALRGKTIEEIEQAIPKSWARQPTAKGGGTRYVHPENKGEQIRVQPGNPNDPSPVKQGPYCRISSCGEVSDPIPLSGNPTLPPP